MGQIRLVCHLVRFDFESPSQVPKEVPVEPAPSTFKAKVPDLVPYAGICVLCVLFEATLFSGKP